MTKKKIAQRAKKTRAIDAPHPRKAAAAAPVAETPTACRPLWFEENDGSKRPLSEAEHQEILARRNDDELQHIFATAEDGGLFRPYRFMSMEPVRFDPDNPRHGFI